MTSRSTRNRNARNWIVERLTRRRAWAAIAILVTWNVVVGGVFLRQMLADDMPLAVVVPQVVMVLVLVVAISVWLLRNASVASKRGQKLPTADRLE
jgi:uncharacterized membrane protein YeiH